MSKLRLVILIIGIILIFLYVFFIMLPLLGGYNFFVQYAAELINKKQRIDAIKNAISPVRFLQLKLIAFTFGVVLVIVIGVALWYARKVGNWCARILGRVKRSALKTVAVWKTVSLTAKIIFIATILYLVIQSIWLMIKIPFIHDEAYTITNFVLPGPIASVTFYPYPNNHILFSLFSYPFSFLPLPPNVSFRIPSLIAAILTCLVLFRVLLIFFRDTVAAIAVAVFVSMLPVTTYAVFARGYSLMFLFSSLSLYVYVRLLLNPQKIYWCLLALFSILGLYTVPTFMYPLTAIMVPIFCYAIFNRNVRFGRSALITYSGVTILTLVLYTPVIITSGGWEGFVKVIYVGYDYTARLSEVILFLDGVYRLQFFERPEVAIAFFAFSLVVSTLVIRNFFSGKITSIDAFFYFACFLGSFIPLLAFIMQRKLVAARSHVYLSLFIVCFLFLSIKLGLQGQWKRYSYVGLSFCIIAMSFVFARTSNAINGEVDSDITADLFAESMVKHSSSTPDTCYSFDLFYLASIQLQYALNKKDLTVYQWEKNSPSSRPFDINDNYKWIIYSTVYREGDSLAISRAYHPVVVRKDGILFRRNE